MRWRSPSPEATRAIAAALGRSIDAEGLVVALEGALGAGKTVFVKGLATGLGVDPALVASPTFVIASEYPGARPLAHVDLYRVESEAELEAAGWLDLLRPGVVIAVEWADRLPQALPEDRLDVALERPAGALEARAETREICAQPHGPRSRTALERWAERLAAACTPAAAPSDEGAPWR